VDRSSLVELGPPGEQYRPWPGVAPRASLSSPSGGSDDIQPAVGHDWIRHLAGPANNRLWLEPSVRNPEPGAPEGG
jgi:hypothetical protein